MERHVLHGRLQVVQVVLIEWLQTQPVSKGPPRNPHTSTHRPLGNLAKGRATKKSWEGLRGLMREPQPGPVRTGRSNAGTPTLRSRLPPPHRGCQLWLRAELEVKEQVAPGLTSRGTQWTHFPRGPCRHLREQRGNVSGQSTGARAEGGQEPTLQPCPPSGPGQNVLGWTCRDPPSLLRRQGPSWVGQGPTM